MNRENKFRVWDNDQKEFYHFDLLSPSDIPLIVSFGAPVDYFIGLYDQNNEPLFDKDICEWYNRQTNTSGKGDIRYNKRVARYEIADGDVYYQMNPYVVDFKKIGNTYENPELLIP